MKIIDGIKGKLVEWLAPGLIKKYTGSVVRAGLAYVSGLVSVYAIPEVSKAMDYLIDGVPIFTNAISAVVILALSVGLSAKEKKDAAKTKE